jgi:hypothetical protein
MIWLLTRTVVWPYKVGTGSMKLGYRTGRLFGYRRIFVFGIGVAVGLLLAPVTGAELRNKLRALIEGDTADEIAPWQRPGSDVVDLTLEATP